MNIRISYIDHDAILRRSNPRRPLPYGLWQYKGYLTRRVVSIGGNSTDHGVE